MFKKRMKDPVAGQALVVSVKAILPNANPVTFQGKLVVSADGVAKTTVEHKERYWRKGTVGKDVSVSEIWPNAGQTVPVTVDRANPTRVRLDWDQIRRGAKADQASAQKAEEERLLREAYSDDSD
jgi:hypothetical protein